MNPTPQESKLPIELSRYCVGVDIPGQLAIKEHQRILPVMVALMG